MKNQIQKHLALPIGAILGVAGLSIISHFGLVEIGVSSALSQLISGVAFAGLSVVIAYQFLSIIFLSNHTKVDKVTSLLNREAFYNEFDSMLSSAENLNHSFHLVVIDLNKFKKVNNTLGHNAGDKMLSQIALRIVTSIPKNCIIGRLGGDEFGILIPDQVNSRSYITIINSILDSLSTPVELGQHSIYVSAAIGVATYPGMGANTNELMRCADIAMYASKRTLKDFCVYDIIDDTATSTELTLLGEIRNAIHNEEFILYYQPKKNLRTNKIESVECLARWEHPIRGILTPNVFIPVAEQSGMIKYLTHLVIKEAASGYASLKEIGYDLDFSINVSPNDIVDPATMTTIIKNIVRADMDPSKLILEVTETAFMHDPDSAFKVLAALESLGIKLSIDDFGVGHSSLIYLKNFPVCELKFDRSFISDIESNKEGASIVSSNINLAHTLGVTTVAEGVETKEVETIVKDMGCDYAQGYYISRPLPLDKFIEWLQINQPRDNNDN